MADELQSSTVPANASSDAIVEVLRAQGLVLLPSFLPATIVSDLNAEFDLFFR